LKPQQKDLMQVLRRPVETTPSKRTQVGHQAMSATCTQDDYLTLRRVLDHTDTQAWLSILL